MQGDDDELFPDPSWLKRQTIIRARNGDLEAALDLILSAAASLHARSINPVVADYRANALTDAWHSIKNDGSLAEDALASAFNLKRQPFRTASLKTAEKASNVAIWIEIAVSERGLTWKDAKGLASDLFGVSNVDRALRDAGPIESFNLDACVLHFESIGKPLPPRQ